MNRLAFRLALSLVKIIKKWIPNFKRNEVNCVFFTCFPYCEKIKADLCDHQAVFVSVYPAYNFLMTEAIFMKRGMCTIARESTSAAYFINPFH
jgi:hypothetical protein